MPHVAGCLCVFFNFQLFLRSRCESSLDKEPVERSRTSIKNFLCLMLFNPTGMAHCNENLIFVAFVKLSVYNVCYQ